MARLDKISVFDPSPKTHVPLWWNNVECLLVFLSHAILHSCRFTWNIHKTTQLCYTVGGGLVECGDIWQEICLWFSSQNSCTSPMNQCCVFTGILIMNNSTHTCFSTLSPMISSRLATRQVENPIWLVGMRSVENAVCDRMNVNLPTLPPGMSSRGPH